MAVDSMIRQSHANWALIIIDDCSPDESLLIAEEFAALDSRIAAVGNAENVGLIGNWQVGFRAHLNLGRAEYVALLDPEDEWSEDWMAAVVAALGTSAETSIGVSATDYWWPAKNRRLPRRYASIAPGTSGKVVARLVLSGYGVALHGLWRVDAARWLADLERQKLSDLLVMEDVLIAYLVSRFGLPVADEPLMTKLKGLKGSDSLDGGEVALYQTMRKPWKRWVTAVRVLGFLASEWAQGRAKGGLLVSAPWLILRVDKARWQAYRWSGPY